MIIVDGGSENNNEIINNYFSEIIFSTRKLIAQKDIIFSNSMIESVNKTLKYRYLFTRDIPDFETTVNYLKDVIPDYNNRPHSKLHGLTPFEAFNNRRLDLESIKNGFIRAGKNRILQNRLVRCKNCE
jgi:putative transposase